MKRAIPGLILAALVLPFPTSAHTFSTSYSKYRVDGNHVYVQFMLSLSDLHNGPNLDKNNDGAVSDAEFKDGVPLLFEAITNNYHVAAPDPPVESTIENAVLLGEAVKLDIRYTFSNDVKMIKVSSSLERLTQPDHRHLFRIGEGDDTREAVIDAARPSLDVDVEGPKFLQTVRDFVKLGMLHIFTGYDHLAFLVGLLLMTTTLLSLLKIVTSFTIAHSITLALATFQVLSLPARLIESLIALSIAYVAIENFTGRTLVHRWKIAFGFGLVHGFGFSNVLREMELTRRTLAISLFSFNVGVEIGQLIFVSLLFPLVIHLAASRWKEQVLSTASLSIMCLGFYWFVQRAFLL